MQTTHHLWLHLFLRKIKGCFFHLPHVSGVIAVHLTVVYKAIDFLLSSGVHNVYRREEPFGTANINRFVFECVKTFRAWRPSLFVNIGGLYCPIRRTVAQLLCFRCHTKMH
jgi:hypothetical protein